MLFSSTASTPGIRIQTWQGSLAFPLDRQPKRIKKRKKQQTRVSSGDGAAGYRSLYLSHAKRALYHLSYSPMDRRVTGFPVARWYVTPSHVAKSRALFVYLVRRGFQGRAARRPGRRWCTRRGCDDACAGAPAESKDGPSKRHGRRRRCLQRARVGYRLCDGVVQSKKVPMFSAVSW